MRLALQPSLRQFAILAWSVTCCGAAPTPTDEPLPRVPPTAPSAALATLKVADGFRVEQVAAEPLVTDPVAMAFDEWGRLFVVEMRDYSEQDQERLGRVRLLVDENGDGHFDKSTIYAEGLSWPTAIACYDGGVFVGAAPDLFYLKDDDGDGIADRQETVYSGFARDNVQGLLNSFHWGLDNRIHCSTSSNGALLQSTDQAGEEANLRGRDFAFDPKTRKLVPTTGGGQHGMSFNRWGDRFVCSNSDHLQAIVFEDHYLSRNPYQATPAPRRSIAADGPQAAVYRTSPVEAWREARTKLRVAGLAPGPIEGGGRSAGYFTSATGVTIYEGDLWPEEYRGWAIVADVGSNLIHRKRMTADGVTYRGERVDAESEFLTSTDIWFRPVQMAIGPDGALYVADMCREVIEHPKSLPPEIKSQLDLTSGRDRGRIYRVVPTNYEQKASKPLGESSADELVAALDHANLWRRTTAARLLYERQDQTAVEPLRKLAAAAKGPEGRIAALYALDGLGALMPAELLQALDDSHPQVRRHAIRLAESRLAESSELRERLVSLVEDEDLMVRFQLALSLGALDAPERAAALAQLIRSDAKNADLVGAVLTSVHSCAGPVLQELLADAPWTRSSEARTLVAALVGQIMRQQREEDIAVLVDLLDSAYAASHGEAAALVLGETDLPEDAQKSPQLASLVRVQRQAAQTLLSSARTTLDSDDPPLEERVAAVRALALGDFDAERERFAEQLTPAQPAEVQGAVLEALGRQKSPDVAQLVLAAWGQFTPELRRRAVELLARREAWLQALFAAMEAGDIRVADVDPTFWATWSRHPSKDVQTQVAKLRENAVSSDRQAVFNDYKAVLQQPGDVARGKEVFAKNCVSCHRLDSQGHELGPNLAAMNNRGAEAILYNILAPNAEVESRYLNYSVTDVEGIVRTGVITSETASSITLRGANNETHTVLRVDIDEDGLRSTGVSLMPDGLEQQIDKTAMADLLAYLREMAANPTEAKR
ncbi:MAG: PVC-type heme-binding CxxCH protein [Pirellulales bacterium]